MNSGKLSINDKSIIKERLRTSYDSIISPPEDYLNTLNHVITFEPKNFTTLCIKELEDHIIEKFIKNDPLVLKLSEDCLKRLKHAIRISYYGNNVLDLARGGLGLVIPSFAGLMSDFCFSIKDRNMKDIKNVSDKEFYAKYLWCFELECQIISDLIQKAS